MSWQASLLRLHQSSATTFFYSNMYELWQSYAVKSNRLRSYVVIPRQNNFIEYYFSTLRQFLLCFLPSWPYHKYKFCSKPSLTYSLERSYNRFSYGLSNHASYTVNHADHQN